MINPLLPVVIILVVQLFKLAACPWRYVELPEVLLFFILLPFHQFKIRLPMLTNRADEVVGDFFADVFVAADPAAPDLLAVGSGAYMLRLWFDVGLGFISFLLMHGFDPL